MHYKACYHAKVNYEFNTVNLFFCQMFFVCHRFAAVCDVYCHSTNYRKGNAVLHNCPAQFSSFANSAVLSLTVIRVASTA